ncbi:MAG: hypothetical protein IK005_10540 [Paludibacteraceae bacterium]|nr:hypothetical protein [Paludibacteraceae bacterium]MBR4840897.1 hypothetical protein [Paludibacteraceae bacterium]
METKTNILDSLKGEKNPFKVPEGYFESLGPVLQEVIDQKENVVKTETFLSRFRPMLYAAASVAILVCVTFTFLTNHQENVDQARNQVPEEINGIQTKILYTHLEEESIIDYLLSEEE